MEKLQIASNTLFSIALIYLASVLLIMVLEVKQSRETIPDILRQVKQIEIDSDIHGILKQVAQITNDIPPVIKEVSAIRKEIPAILHEVAQVRQQIPSILVQVEETRQIIPPILHEIEETRAIVPGVLQEVAAVRKEAPELLDKTQKLMADAQQISTRAGEGVTEGVVKGLITAPVDLIEGEVREVTKPKKKED